MKAEQLAIGTYAVGEYSETFIRRHVIDLAPGNTVLFTTKPRKEYWIPHCPALHLYERKRWSSWSLLFRAVRRFGLAKFADKYEVKKFLRKHNVTVLMGEYLNFSLPWLEVAHDLGIRFFAHAHGVDVSEALRDPKYVSKYLSYNKANGVIVMSPHIKKRLTEIGLKDEKIHVVPYGIDVPDKPVIRSMPRDVIKCLAVGRMVPKKAPLMTLSAFQIASESFDTLHLDYVGTGELFEEALGFVKAVGLEDKVSFHGALSNDAVLDLMMDADIFLQHSVTDPETGDEEGLPVAILEAMARSLPVVSTRHAGIPEAVEEGVTGFLVDERDYNDMAERIVELARDGDLRIEMGKAAWNRAKREFTWDLERGRLLHLLGLS